MACHEVGGIKGLDCGSSKVVSTRQYLHIMVDLLSPTSMNGDSGGIWIVDITIEMNCDTAAKSRVGTLKI